MHYEGHELDKSKPEFAQAIEERTKYGVSTVDTWGFDSYLLAVLTNGLAKLADDLHGWPSSIKWPTFEGWQEAIRAASDDAYWLVVTVDELEGKNYDENYPKHPANYDDIEEFLNAEVNDGDLEQWKKGLQELNAERELRKNRLFDFIKENLWALWD